MLSAADPLPDKPRRIAVAGVSGTGKTTLARNIAEIATVPHTEIDALFHGAGWMARPEFLADVRTLVAADAWVTEWQYTDARPLLTERADLLVWLDLPFWRVTFPRVVRRTVRRRLRREQLWNGNVEPPFHTILHDPEHIVRWAVGTRHKYRERIPALDGEHPHLTIVRLRTRDDVDRWLHGALTRVFAQE